MGRAALRFVKLGEMTARAILCICGSGIALLMPAGLRAKKKLSKKGIYAMPANDMCDGSGPCSPGEVRVLPVGSSPHHGNMILCFSCFNREIAWRKERNRQLGKDCQFKTPFWNELKIYNP